MYIQEAPRRCHVRDHEAHHVSCLSCFLPLSSCCCTHHATQLFWLKASVSVHKLFVNSLDARLLFCQLACCCYPTAKMKHFVKDETPLWYHHNAWQHRLFDFHESVLAGFSGLPRRGGGTCGHMLGFMCRQKAYCRRHNWCHTSEGSGQLICPGKLMLMDRTLAKRWHQNLSQHLTIASVLDMCAS